MLPILMIADFPLHTTQSRVLTLPCLFIPGDGGITMGAGGGVDQRFLLYNTICGRDTQ